MLANDSSQGATNSTWIPNSCAFFHVTGEPQNLHQLSQFDGPGHIFIANGQGLHINGFVYPLFCLPLTQIFPLN